MKFIIKVFYPEGYSAEKKDARSWLSAATVRLLTEGIAGVTLAALDKPVRIEYIDMPESLRDRYQYYTCAEIGKLRAAGYTAPIGSLQDSIADMIRNYLVPGKYRGD